MNLHYTKLILTIIISLNCVFNLTSCNTDGNEYYGIVEVYNGKPIIPRMIPRSVIGPMPAGVLPSHKVRGIAVMDSGCDYDGISSLTYLTNLLDSYRLQHNHKGDLPCHFFIDMDGYTYSGRDIVSPGEIHFDEPFLLRTKNVNKETALKARLNRKTKAEHDVNGYILICVLGDYDAQLLSEAQEKSLYQLTAYLVYQHNIPLDQIYGLNKLIPESNNPGFYLQNYLQTSILQANIPPPPGESRMLMQHSQ